MYYRTAVYVYGLCMEIRVMTVEPPSFRTNSAEAVYRILSRVLKSRNNNHAPNRQTLTPRRFAQIRTCPAETITVLQRNRVEEIETFNNFYLLLLYFFLFAYT